MPLATLQRRTQSMTTPPPSDWRFGKWLMGLTLEELENLKSPEEIYMKLVQPNIDVMAERMSSMKLGERNVEVTDYPSPEEVMLMHKLLEEYDPEYDQ